ncbi:unnamed protein product [Gadus morhua 'NCC']
MALVFRDYFYSNQGCRTVLTSFHECRSKTGPVLICYPGVLKSGSGSSWWSGSCGCFLLEGHCSAAGSVVYNMAALLHVCNFHIVGLME